MLIQPITNQKYKTNLQKTKPSTSFRGQLGNKVIQNIEKNGVKNIDEVLKILGITGASTVIISNLKDLLESVSEKFRIDTKKFKELVSTNQNMQAQFEKINIKERELRSKEIKLAANELTNSVKERNISLKEKSIVEQELAIKKITEQLDIRKIKLNERNNHLIKKEQELDKYSSKLYGKEMDLKQQKFELEKRKKNIEETTREKVTAQIRAEEEKKAEENVINIMKALDERENAITNAENLIKEAEIENIKNSFRVLYGDKNINISKVTNYGTQLLILVNTFRTLDFNTGLSIAEPILDRMRNKENIVTEEMFQFIKLLATYNCRCYSYNDFLTAIDMVKDKNGNLDLDKSSYLLANASIKRHMSPVVESMKKRYKL